jgi:predicted TIM-barrel fold metal-dependent hydrolase
MYHTQLNDVIDLAHDLPRLSIVLDHVGGPIGNGPYAGRRDEVAQDWRHFMVRLSRFDNVCVKLGGFGMPMSGFDFHERSLPPASGELAAAWGDHMNAAIDIFGAERCMFESNFPVDKGTTSYPVLWNAFKKIASRRTEDEKDALFHDTAQRVYGLTGVDRRESSGPRAADTG